MCISLIVNGTLNSGERREENGTDCRIYIMSICTAEHAVGISNLGKLDTFQYVSEFINSLRAWICLTNIMKPVRGVSAYICGYY